VRVVPLAALKSRVSFHGAQGGAVVKLRLAARKAKRRAAAAIK
jgi:hypothetical protein